MFWPCFGSTVPWSCFLTTTQDNKEVSAQKTQLKKLDVILSTVLRQVEVSEMPLELRRLQINLSYFVYLQGHRDDQPPKSVLIPTWEQSKTKRDDLVEVYRKKLRKLVLQILQLVLLWSFHCTLHGCYWFQRLTQHCMGKLRNTREIVDNWQWHMWTDIMDMFKSLPTDPSNQTME